MEHKDKRAPFFTAAMTIVVLMAINALATPFMGAKLGFATAYGIGLALSLVITVLASISRLRGEPPRRRCLFVIILMILAMITNIIGMIDQS